LQLSSVKNSCFSWRLDRKELLEVFLVMREVWLRRNNFIFQGGFIPPEQLVLRAKSTASGFEDALQKEPSSNGIVGRTLPKWQVPAGGWLKLNWDAALNMQSKKMGIGIVVRNEKGEFVAAMARVLPSLNDPTVAEALAAWHVVTVCVDKGFQKIMLEGTLIFSFFFTCPRKRRRRDSNW
jgi:hypothetical protein